MLILYSSDTTQVIQKTLETTTGLNKLSKVKIFNKLMKRQLERLK